MRIPVLSAALTALVFVGTGAAFLLLHPDTPLPDEWNPTTPLDIAAPPTLLTDFKLRRAVASESACLAALPDGAVTPLEPLVDSEQCGIDPRVRLSSAGEAALAPLETTCAIALRMAMWERHSVQPAARRHLGSEIGEIRHLSSYNCRPIRTAGGEGRRMSTHATAEAIDISGFVTADGEAISLMADWEGPDAKAAFLKEARDGACRWFETTLGPEYNSLHRDHFHLQSRGWGLCR